MDDGVQVPGESVLVRMLASVDMAGAGMVVDRIGKGRGEGWNTILVCLAAAAAGEQSTVKRRREYTCST
jgi:hypothetical protein